MDYQFKIGFKTIGTPRDLLMFLRTFETTMIYNSEKYIENFIKEIPSIDNPKINNEDWLYHKFSFPVLYWSSEHLLGICLGDVGNSLSHSVESLFDTICEFENKSSRNYDFSYWDNKIPLFKKLRENASQYGKLDLVDSSGGFPNLNDVSQDFDYYRCIRLYDDIFQYLELDKWASNQTLDTCDTLSVQCIQNDEQLYYLKDVIVYLLLAKVVRGFQ